jgi:hypothetical protein
VKDDQQYQPGDYNPGGNDFDPPAMTESERLAKRRFEAGFVFEMLPDPVYEAARASNRNVARAMEQRLLEGMRSQDA